MALLAVALAVAGRALVQHFGGGPYRFPILQLAVIVAAFYGSWGPGLLAVILVTVAWAWFLPPMGMFRVDHLADLMNLVTVAAINVLIVWGFSSARRKLAEEQDPEPGIHKAAGWTPERLLSPASLSRKARQPLTKLPRGYRGSRLALGCLFGVAVLLAIFGSWGTLTTAGTTYFDDEAWLVPLLCLAMAPAILIFGVGFLPVHSFEREASSALGDRTSPS